MTVRTCNSEICQGQRRVYLPVSVRQAGVYFEKCSECGRRFPPDPPRRKKTD